MKSIQPFYVQEIKYTLTMVRPCLLENLLFTLFIIQFAYSQRQIRANCHLFTSNRELLLDGPASLTVNSPITSISTGYLKRGHCSCVTMTIYNQNSANAVIANFSPFARWMCHWKRTPAMQGCHSISISKFPDFSLTFP